jgi:Protein of unknown function (DUF2510)
VHRAGLFVWALVSAGLMTVGAFGPWVTALGVISVNGWDVQKKEAGILIVLALLGALAVFTQRTTSTSGSVAVFAGLGGLLLTGWEHHRITSALASAAAASSTQSFIHMDVGAIVHVGWGLDLALLASASLMLAGIASFFGQVTLNSAPADGSATTYEPTQAAGWYRDPNDEALLRYWNGYGWTTQTAKPAS